jgi:hypothetical protein
MSAYQQGADTKGEDMPLGSDARDELHSLLEAVCEESITADQVRRLEELVLTRPEAEAYYVQYMDLHAALILRFARSGGAGDQAFAIHDDAGPVLETVGRPGPRTERGRRFVTPRVKITPRPGRTTGW